MGWPLVVVIAIVIIGGVALLSAVVAGNASVAAEKAKGEYGEQYRMIAADYETLAKETRDAAQTMQADLAKMREKVDSIENMMREVG
jgi:ribosome-binding protein aMBF1 (putative translation factor)